MVLSCPAPLLPASCTGNATSALEAGTEFGSFGEASDDMIAQLLRASEGAVYSSFDGNMDDHGVVSTETAGLLRAAAPPFPNEALHYPRLIVVATSELRTPAATLFGVDIDPVWAALAIVLILFFLREHLVATALFLVDKAVAWAKAVFTPQRRSSDKMGLVPFKPCGEDMIFSDNDADDLDDEVPSLASFVDGTAKRFPSSEDGQAPSKAEAAVHDSRLVGGNHDNGDGDDDVMCEGGDQDDIGSSDTDLGDHGSGMDKSADGSHPSSNTPASPPTCTATTSSEEASSREAATPTPPPQPLQARGHTSLQPRKGRALNEQLLGACFCGNRDLMLSCLDRGADPNYQAQAFGDAPIHAAVFVCMEDYGDYNMIDDLIEHGADINIANRAGHTVLSQASGRGHDEMVAFLLRRGAKRDVKTELGASPRRIALTKGFTSIARMLDYSDT